MTVAELIEALREYEPEEYVVVEPNKPGCDPPPILTVHSDYYGRVSLSIQPECERGHP